MEYQISREKERREKKEKKRKKNWWNFIRAS
jgi:hypothetical protein